MGNKELAFRALLAGAAANLLQAATERGALPEKVASHFNAAGVPDSWMPRDAFLGFYAALIVFLAAMLWSTARALPGKPDSRINLPHKAYWLAPERRAGTMAEIEAFVLWFGAVTMLLMLDVFHQVFRVNARQAAVLEHPLPSLAAYVGAATLMTIALYRRFSRLPDAG